MHSIADVAAVGAQNGYLLECRFDTNPFTNPFSRGWHPIRLPIRLPIHFLVVNQYAAVGAQNGYLIGYLMHSIVHVHTLISWCWASDLIRKL